MNKSPQVCRRNNFFVVKCPVLCLDPFCGSFGGKKYHVFWPREVYIYQPSFFCEKCGEGLSSWTTCPNLMRFPRREVHSPCQLTGGNWKTTWKTNINSITHHAHVIHHLLCSYACNMKTPYMSQATWPMSWIVLSDKTKGHHPKKRGFSCFCPQTPMVIRRWHLGIFGTRGLTCNRVTRHPKAYPSNKKTLSWWILFSEFCIFPAQKYI